MILHFFFTIILTSLISFCMPFTNPYLSHILCVLFSENVITKSREAHLFKQMCWLPFSFVGYFVGIPGEA